MEKDRFQLIIAWSQVRILPGPLNRLHTAQWLYVVLLFLLVTTGPCLFIIFHARLALIAVVGAWIFGQGVTLADSGKRTMVKLNNPVARKEKMHPKACNL
jgi:hypothetical protein